MNLVIIVYIVVNCNTRQYFIETYSESTMNKKIGYKSCPSKLPLKKKLVIEELLLVDEILLADRLLTVFSINKQSLDCPQHSPIYVFLTV